MKTLGRFMEEESMDVEEGTEAAGDRRKVLLNRMFVPRCIPRKEEEQEDDNN